MGNTSTLISTKSKVRVYGATLVIQWNLHCIDLHGSLCISSQEKGPWKSVSKKIMGTSTMDPLTVVLVSLSNYNDSSWAQIIMNKMSCTWATQIWYGIHKSQPLKRCKFNHRNLRHLHGSWCHVWKTILWCKNVQWHGTTIFKNIQSNKCNIVQSACKTKAAEQQRTVCNVVTPRPNKRQWLKLLHSYT